MEGKPDILKEEEDALKDFTAKRAEVEHPTTVTYRKLEIGDYDKGYYEVLSNLTETGDVTKELFEARFNEINPQTSDSYKIIVGIDENTGRVIANGTLLIEKKFIRNCSQCGHVEDIVVHRDYGKQGIGGDIMECLKAIAKVNS